MTQAAPLDLALGKLIELGEKLVTVHRLSLEQKGRRPKPTLVLQSPGRPAPLLLLRRGDVNHLARLKLRIHASDVGGTPVDVKATRLFLESDRHRALSLRTAFSSDSPSFLSSPSAR